MKLVFKLYPSLPSLSWAAEITADAAVIHHGPGLEHGDDWLVDGCWPGAFGAGLPAGDVDGFFAFALRVVENEIRIDCPTHPLERICILRLDDRLIASPSIPFILAVADSEVDSAYPDHMIDHYRAISKNSENCGSMPLAGGQTLQMIVNRRVTINARLEIKIEYRAFERSFRDFSEYKTFLVETMEGLFANITSTARRAGNYGLVSAVSSGYDSLMVTVLAAPLGVKQAITFSAPGDTEDSAEPFGPQLGVQVHPVSRHAYQQLPGLPEVEFLATAARGEDVVLAGAEPYFRNNAVLTGMYAEVADKNLPNLSADILRSNTVNCGMIEYRWRARFHQIAIGHAGCMGMMSLKALSHSKEMEPWSVGGTYDRPFARRVIEEAGIARGSFAKAKIGMISVKFDVDDDSLQSIMNPRSHAALMEFIAREKSRRPLRQRAKRLMKFAAYRTERVVGHALQRAGIFDHVSTSFDLPSQSVPSHASYLFPWSARLQKEIYTNALKRSA